MRWDGLCTVIRNNKHLVAQDQIIRGITKKIGFYICYDYLSSPEKLQTFCVRYACRI